MTSKANLKLTAVLSTKSALALDLASELELDRGNAVIGSVWTKGDMIQFLASPLNRIYAWSEVTTAEIVEEFNPAAFKPRPYRVVVGISYEPDADPDSSKIRFSHKHISHLVVDASKGLEFAYHAVFDCLDLLAIPTPVGDHQTTEKEAVLSCAVDSRDVCWAELIAESGFSKVSEVEVDDRTMIYFERRA